MRRLVIDDLTFDVKRSRRRTTVGITIDRDGSLIIRAPTDCPWGEIERVAREKRVWIYAKLAEKERLQAVQPATRKEYVSGEGFYYLGRSYRLLLVEPDDDVSPLRLYQGRFLLRNDEQARGRQHFIDWYTEHARVWIEGRLERFVHRVDVAPAGVQVRDLGYRWGSCSPNRTVRFHWRVILLPPRIVDYLLVHELAHLHEPHHGDAFWQRVGRTLPGYEERKRWLSVHGAKYDL